MLDAKKTYHGRMAVNSTTNLRKHRTRVARHLVTVFGLALAFCVLPESHLIAQQNVTDDARTVAARVQSFYDQTASISAEFYQTYVDILYKRTDRSKGRVVFKKPGLMRWDYALPNGKLVVSDGRKLLVYEPGDDNEETGQVYEQQFNEAQLPQALAFLTGAGRLEKSFTFQLLDSQHEGFPNGYVLELRPLTPNPHYDRILFYVERDERLSGLVSRVLIIDPNGNRNRFDFSKLKFNRAIDESLFKWQPPAGTRHLNPR
jgi:outer membrane lipoprotein carrier protein